jgi:hypothetical protein
LPTRNPGLKLANAFSVISQTTLPPTPADCFWHWSFWRRFYALTNRKAKIEFAEGRELPMSAIAKTISTDSGQKENAGHPRAEALADRIEQGAALLAAFAEQLSDEEWTMPVSTTDRRPVGVIVNHVASVYPIEVGAARAIAGGNAVTDVTWEAIADMNAKHAIEQIRTHKADTLELLQRNSREAAAAVRTFTDAELDQAAPFSLSFGAPVTAQFVIEDHALRHSWHHLARIRKAVGR